MDDRKRRVDVAPTSDDPSIQDDVRARQIRQDIARTRDDLSETVDAIQEKLSPGNIVANAKSATTEKVKDMASNAADSAKDMAATAADTAGEWWEASGGNTVVDRLRNNPIPALMTGVGVAWLLMSNGERYRGNGERYRRYRTASDRTTEWSTGDGRRPSYGQPERPQRDARRRSPDRDDGPAVSTCRGCRRGAHWRLTRDGRARDGAGKRAHGRGARHGARASAAGRDR